MEFKDRWINQQDSPRIPPIYRYLTERSRTHRAGSSRGSNIGQTHQEFFPDQLHQLYSLPRHSHYSLPSPNPHPHDLQEAIQIEIEKEKIREEIIVSEIARRRVLEAEVRRELMMERDFAAAPRITSGTDGFPFRSSPQIESVSPRAMRVSHVGARADESSLEERITMLLNGKHASGGFEAPPFQRGTADSRVKPVSQGGNDKEKQKIIFVGKSDENISGSKRKTVPSPRVDTSANGRFETLPFISNADLRVSEVKPVSEGGHEKPNVIFPGKPDESISGSKRKAVTPPRVDASYFPSSGGGGGIGIFHKKGKKRWHCTICNVNSTSKQSLNVHFGGRKHKSKEAAAKGYSINELRPEKGTAVGHSINKLSPEKGTSVGYNINELFPEKGTSVGYSSNELPLEKDTTAGYSINELPPEKGTTVGYSVNELPPEKGTTVGYSINELPPEKGTTVGYSINELPPKIDTTVGYSINELPPEKGTTVGYSIIEHPPENGTTVGYNINELPPKKGTTVDTTGTFWCEVCKVGMTSEKDLSIHEMGRKHVNRQRQSILKPCILKSKTSVLVTPRADECVDVKNVSPPVIIRVDESTNDEFVNPVKTENQELVVVDIAKPETHELVEEVLDEDDWALYITEPDENGIVENDGGIIMEPFVPNY